MATGYMVAAAAAPVERCALCGCQLTLPRSINCGLCRGCEQKPEAALLARDGRGRAKPRVPGPTPAPQPQPQLASKPRTFSPAEKSLIKSVHGYMPVQDLLTILNERLLADRPDAALWTPEQLHTEVQDLVTPIAGGADWTQLRTLLTQARRSGVLAEITPQVIEDFSVVFSLTPSAAMHLRDVVTNAQRERG